MPYTHYFMNHAHHDTPVLMNPELLYTGMVSESPQWFSTCHSHDFCEILYAAQGRGTAVADAAAYEIGPGDLVVYNPGVKHEECSRREEPLVLLFLAIRDFSVPGWPPGHLLPPGHSPLLPCGEWRCKMDWYFRELLLESSRPADYGPQIIRALLSTILALILRLVRPAPVGGRPISRECEKIKSYLDEHYTSPITLGQLSETVYISRHYLSHLFKEQTGTSPIRYLTAKRVATACELLTTSALSVAEIGRQVGYENPLYFSQVFKKLKGVSPVDYRAAHS